MSMTKKQKKKRDEIADAISDKDMKDRYGDKNIKWAIATKLAMKESTILSSIGKSALKIIDEGIFDFLPKQKTKMKPGGVGIDNLSDQEKKKYKMPMPKQPIDGNRMRMPPARFPNPNPYKTTLV